MQLQCLHFLIMYVLMRYDCYFVASLHFVFSLAMLGDAPIPYKLTENELFFFLINMLVILYRSNLWFFVFSLSNTYELQKSKPFTNAD